MLSYASINEGVPPARVMPAPPRAGTFPNGPSHPSLVSVERSYSAGEEIYGEDEPADFIYQVVRGAVRAYKLLGDGRRQIGAFYLPGDVFGLDFGATHGLTAEALIGTTVRQVSRNAVEALAKKDPQVACDLWRLTAGTLRHAEGHMLLLGCKTAIERVAAFLLEMDRRLSLVGTSVLPMGRQDIGDYLGLTLETVSRSLSRLHDKGVLDFHGARHITLRNRTYLKQLNA